MTLGAARALWLGREVVVDFRDRPIARKVPGRVVDVIVGDRGSVAVAIRPTLAQDAAFDCVFQWVALERVEAD